MITISPYLNFDGNTEEVFNFYKAVFGGEFTSFQRFGEVPGYGENVPAEERNKVMHVALPVGNTEIMASDISPAMGHKLVVGNNKYITLGMNDKVESERIFNALSEGGRVDMPLQDTFWGAYYGVFVDKYGVQWMINCVPNS